MGVQWNSGTSKTRAASATKDDSVPTPNVPKPRRYGWFVFGLIVLGEGGVVQQGNFDTYRSLRIGEMPDVQVSIIKSTEDPTGVGEPGLPPAAPAVANAWRKLTGKSVRRLPFIHGDNR